MRAFLFLAFVLPACSSGSSGGTTGDAATDSSSDTFSDSSSDSVATYTCPTTAPTPATPCDTLGLVCEYGGDAHGSCTDLFTCTASTGAPLWFTHEKDPTCGTNPSDCPASFGSIEGTLCTKSDETCDYPEGRCGCEPCSSDGGLVTHWHCKAWSDAPTGCAAPRPLLGTPCAPDGLQCDYFQCCRGPGMGPREQCKNGVWQPYVDVGCSCALPTCG